MSEPDEGSAETTKPKRSAGRDLPVAITVGLSFAGAVVVSLVFIRPAFVGVLTLLAVTGVAELAKALRTRDIRIPVLPLLVGTIASEIVAWFHGVDGLGVGMLLTAFGVLVWRLFGPASGYVRDVTAGVFVAMYVPLLAGFAVVLAVPDNGATLVLAFGATVVASDIGGYASGVFFGRHKMAPLISPGKSWEGFAGSIVVCMAVGILFLVVWLDTDWWRGAIFGAVLAVTATLGDLIESMIKRDLGIKDMGNVLPGHGGVMDRLDSLLPGAAVSYLLLSVLL